MPDRYLFWDRIHAPVSIELMSRHLTYSSPHCLDNFLRKLRYKMSVGRLENGYKLLIYMVPARGVEPPTY